MKEKENRVSVDVFQKREDQDRVRTVQPYQMRVEENVEVI